MLVSTKMPSPYLKRGAGSAVNASRDFFRWAVSQSGSWERSVAIMVLSYAAFHFELDQLVELDCVFKGKLFDDWLDEPCNDHFERLVFC